MKLIFYTILLSTANFSFAMDNANLVNQSFTCNGIRIESNIQESDLIGYCNNVTVKDDTQIISGQNAMRLRGSDQIDEDDTTKTIINLRKVSFTTDKNISMKCYYRNNTLTKCEYSK